MPARPHERRKKLARVASESIARFGRVQFDDVAAQTRIRCPRLCFVGSADEIDYDERWGGVHVSMAGPVIDRRAELEALGWQVRVLEGLDHIKAMQAAQVVPILRPWLITQLGG